LIVGIALFFLEPWRSLEAQCEASQKQAKTANGNIRSRAYRAEMHRHPMSIAFTGSPPATQNTLN